MAKATLEEMVSDVLADDEAAKADEQAAMNGHREKDAAAFELGKRPAIVNTVDSNGEAVAIDVPMEGAAPAEEPLEVRGHPVLPGFEGLAVDGVVINVSGRPEINVAVSVDLALWQQLRLGARLTIPMEVIVTDRKYHLKLDKEGEDKEMTSHASLKVVGIGLPVAGAI